VVCGLTGLLGGACYLYLLRAGSPARCKRLGPLALSDLLESLANGAIPPAWVQDAVQADRMRQATESRLPKIDASRRRCDRVEPGPRLSQPGGIRNAPPSQQSGLLLDTPRRRQLLQVRGANSASRPGHPVFGFRRAPSARDARQRRVQLRITRGLVLQDRQAA
jgi:hypothetical protein